MSEKHDFPKLFHDNPQYWKPSTFKAKGWTDTVTGYINEANKLSRCLWSNHRLMGRGYSFAVSINIETQQTPEEISNFWEKRVCRNLRRHGLVAFWTREPSKKNHCNYHLIVKSRGTKRSVEDIIEKSMPCRSELPWHKQVQPIKNQWTWCHYITKAKVAGYRNGRRVADKYAQKRLMFVSGLRLQKYGKIGDFWEQPKIAIWQSVRDKEKAISEGLQQPGMDGLSHHIYRLLGGYYSLDWVRRRIGFSADSPGIRRWAAKFCEPSLSTLKTKPVSTEPVTAKTFKHVHELSRFKPSNERGAYKSFVSIRSGPHPTHFMSFKRLRKALKRACDWLCHLQPP